jgi:hypothetical protein
MMTISQLFPADTIIHRQSPIKISEASPHRDNPAKIEIAIPITKDRA